jgi:hypothetical protein
MLHGGLQRGGCLDNLFFLALISDSQLIFSSSSQETTATHNMTKRKENPAKDIFKGYIFKPLLKGRPGATAPAKYHDHTVENGWRYHGTSLNSHGPMMTRL